MNNGIFFLLMLVAFSVSAISFQPLALADNSTSTTNSTDPEPDPEPEPEPYKYEIVHTIQTDKSTYEHDEVIHVTGKSSYVNRVQLTHSNGDNMINAWIGNPANIYDVNYEYDIDLMSLYNGNILQESGNYIINAIQDQTILNTTTAYINVLEPEEDPIIDNSTDSEPESEIPTTMTIEIEDDKVVVWGTISPDATIYENGPTLQNIKPDDSGGLITATSGSFAWDGVNYSTYNWLSNYEDVQGETIFKLWSGNGLNGEVLIQKTKLITYTNEETIIENSTETISNQTVSNPSQSSSTSALENANDYYELENALQAHLTPPENYTLANSNYTKPNSNYALNSNNIEPLPENTTESTIDYSEPIPVNNIESIEDSFQSNIENATEPIPLKKQENTIFSDKSVYEDGSIISIEGTYVTDSPYLDLFVYNPSNFNIAAEKLRVSQDDRFETTFDTSHYLWYENGIYEIQVGNNGKNISLLVEVIEHTEEPASQITAVSNQTLSSSQTDNVTENTDYEISELLEENQRLREEIKDLEERVDYLSELLENIQGIFNIFY